MAVSMTLTLKRTTLKNVDDKAGRWQHQGGSFKSNKKLTGHYAITRRVTTGGTTAQNTAMLTITLFFDNKRPPENITLQGAHDFSSGDAIGSVSAASNKFSHFIDGQFFYDGGSKKLKITSN